MARKIIGKNNKRRIISSGISQTKTSKGAEDIKHPQTFLFKEESFYNEVDVSVIIPLYKSRHYIENQILNWKKEDIKTEIIYIDDACPMKSHEYIVPTLKKIEKINYKICVNRVNVGYGHSCNVGASYASGKYLIFLNADTVPENNWIKPLLNRMESDKKIGIVGNLQLKKVGKDILIDSAGSEWYQRTRCFIHIGRNILNGTLLSKPFNIKEAPSYCLTAGERQMVTGCCFMISKKLFEEVGGFDILYRIGYFEDTDLNMKVRQLGYKIFYEPESRIYHYGSHSGANGHKYMNWNKDRFYEKWHKFLVKNL